MPGIHVLALRREPLERWPWLAGEVIALFDRAKQHWWQRRRLLADTTPWLLAELEHTARVFGADWMPYGRAANATMIADFATELHRQGIAHRSAQLGELFPADELLDSAEVPA